MTMKSAELYAVIGGQYGDEGKGRTVDVLVDVSRHRGQNPLVVRHNSGGQAGHTVVRDGVRHVFKHHGSGTLAGAPTLLGKKFVVNVDIANSERAELHKKRVTPILYVDSRCQLQTPLDALANQLKEIKRGSARHGSCGIGFGETLERVENALGPKLSLGDELTKSKQHDLLDWFTGSVAAAGVTFDDVEAGPRKKAFVAAVMGDFDFTPWLRAVETFRRAVVVTDEATVKELLSTDAVIFEGAQGLMLHREHAHFPHVTRSRTGMEDVADILAEVGRLKDGISVGYCTRPYVTRHGAGPLPDEDPTLGSNVVDETNFANDWQGKPRFAPFKFHNFVGQVQEDAARALKDHPTLNASSVAVLNRADDLPPELQEPLIEELLRHFNYVQVGLGVSAPDTHAYEAHRFRGLNPDARPEGVPVH